MKRKSFLQKALNAWSAIVSLPALYAVARYLSPAAGPPAGPLELVAARRSELVPGTVRLVTSGTRPFFLSESGAGELHAFSARCSHLGCVVQPVSETGGFRCNCHGSLFDRAGVNLTGPAVRPLQPFRVEVRGDDVVVTVI